MVEVYLEARRINDPREGFQRINDPREGFQRINDPREGFQRINDPREGFQKHCGKPAFFPFRRCSLRLTLSQTSPGFHVFAVQAFRKHCGKRRNCS